MDEYISRETAVKKLQMQLLNLEADQDKGEYSELCENRGARDALDEAIYDIRTIKAADVQPVVRCKDCKHRKERHYEESGEKPYIKYECKFTKYSMSDDGFCSFGARMDGDTE